MANVKNDLIKLDAVGKKWLAKYAKILKDRKGYTRIGKNKWAKK